MRFTIYEKRKKLCFPVCPEVYGVVTAICGHSQYSKLVILAHVMCFCGISCSAYHHVEHHHKYEPYGKAYGAEVRVLTA